MSKKLLFLKTIKLIQIKQYSFKSTDIFLNNVSYTVLFVSVAFAESKQL